MSQQIDLHRSFVKCYVKRISKNPKLVAQYEARVALFMQGIRDTPINDHPLTGTMSGKRAFSITADIRVVYVETNDAFVFIDIGTHAQVYGS
jgi:addiction module RelE/StbE family toxin